MPSVRRITKPITVTPDEDGYLIEICSGPESFLFHGSKHLVRGTNMGVRSLLDRDDNEQAQRVAEIRPRGKRAPRHG